MKKVVLIGGGFAGSLLAKKLRNDFEVTLIDTKDYFEFTPGILRTIVEPKHAEKIQMRYSDYLEKVIIEIGEIKRVDGKKVYLKGKELNYDYLVICSGSRYRAPIKEQHVFLAMRAKHLMDAHIKVINSKNIVIVGGGMAGVELAAEIAVHYEYKSVTLIQSHDRLMERNSKIASIYAERFLKEHSVNIILGERVIRGDKKTLLTDKDRKISADIVFFCTGITPNSSFIKGKLRKSVDEKGFINVNENMQVNNFRNVFSAGDVNSCNVEKTAQNAEHQARITAYNINALENGKRLRRYDEKKTPLVISLGKYNGIFEYGKIVLTGIVPAFMKWAIEKREMIRL